MIRNTKKKLQTLVGFDYVVKGKLVAAYTNVEKPIWFLLSQPGVASVMPILKDIIIIYDYLDEFRNLSWSYFSGSQTSIQLKIVKLYNARSFIIKLSKASSIKLYS